MRNRFATVAVAVAVAVGSADEYNDQQCSSGVHWPRIRDLCPAERVHLLNENGRQMKCVAIKCY